MQILQVNNLQVVSVGWLFPAEAVRDSMLAVSGKLNLTMYGSGFDLFDKRGGLSGFKPVETFTAKNQRRMIYAHKVRREPEAVFGAFDCPDAGQSTALRRASTTPIQALNLFNSRFILDQSKTFADRLRREAGEVPESQVRAAWTLAFNRAPQATEAAEATAFVRAEGLQAFCRGILNANEFLFIP